MCIGRFLAALQYLHGLSAVESWMLTVLTQTAYVLPKRDDALAVKAVLCAAPLAALPLRDATVCTHH